MQILFAQNYNNNDKFPIVHLWIFAAVIGDE